MKYVNRYKNLAPSFQVISQALNSGNSFILNLLGIEVFSHNNFSLWFLFSFINVFAQSLIRSSLTELFVIQKLKLGFVLFCSIPLVIVCNILIAVYFFKIHEEQNINIFMLALIFIVYQVQDLARYSWMKFDPKSVLISDFTIFLSFMSLILFEIIFSLRVMSFLILALVIHFASLYPFIYSKKRIVRFGTEAQNNFHLFNTLLTSNLAMFCASSISVVLLNKYLTYQNLINYRTIVLWLSPVASFIRLYWIDLIYETGSFRLGSKTKIPFLNKFFIVVFIFLLMAVTLRIYSPQTSNIQGLCALVLGYISLMIGAWCNPMIIEVRRRGKALINGLLIVSVPFSITIYLLIKVPEVNYLVTFEVSSVVMIVQLFYLRRNIQKLNLNERK